MTRSMLPPFNNSSTTSSTTTRALVVLEPPAAHAHRAMVLLYLLTLIDPGCRVVGSTTNHPDSVGIAESTVIQYYWRKGQDDPRHGSCWRHASVLVANEGERGQKTLQSRVAILLFR